MESLADEPLEGPDPPSSAAPIRADKPPPERTGKDLKRHRESRSPDRATDQGGVPVKKSRLCPDVVVPDTDSVSSSGYGEDRGSEIQGAGLLSLSDEILLKILRLLDAMSLGRLGSSCRRLRTVASDQSLWTRVDTGGVPLSAPRFRKLVLKHVGPKTRRVVVQGYLKVRPKMHLESLSEAALRAMRDGGSHVEDLEIRDCLIDAAKVPVVRELPPTLVRLAILDSEVVNANSVTVGSVVHGPSGADGGRGAGNRPVSFFFGLGEAAPSLKVLDLSRNAWLSNHSLQALCKCPNLEELSLRGCVRIGEVFAYNALVARVGFRKLRRLDLRDTSACDNEVACYGRLPCLTHLWLGHSGPFSDFVKPADSEGDGRITDRGVLSMVPFMGGRGPGGQIVLVIGRGGAGGGGGGQEQQGFNLEFLDLSNTFVTDLSLQALRGLPRLKHLAVTGTPTTSEGRTNFVLGKPDCSLEYEETFPLSGRTSGPT